MPYFDGWKCPEYGLDRRGRFDTFAAAVEAVGKNMLTERNPFFRLLADHWYELFPRSAMRPWKYENGIIFLAVRNAPALYANRGKLKAVKARLAALPNAPKDLRLALRIHNEGVNNL